MNSNAKYSLSEPQRNLLDRMTKLNFGRIEDLVIRGGEPVFDPMPKVIRDIKLGADNAARSNLMQRDFELKAQVVDLFTQFEALGNGRIECLEVKNGLPFRLVVQE